MLRLALVGCGEHSRGSHAAPLKRYADNHPGQIELVAACDLDLDRANQFCREFSFKRAYSELEEMLAAEELDGCACIMPVDRIVDVGTLLLRKQIPCVIEKPLGVSLQQAELLAQVTRETGTPHMVSVNRRFIPYLNQAKRWAQAAGQLQFVRATQTRHARSEDDFIWSTAIHPVDAVRYLAGEIANFKTLMHSGNDLSTIWYRIQLEFQSGVQGVVEVFPTAGMVEESYELFGENFRTRMVAGSGVQRTLQCWCKGQLEVNEVTSEAEPEDLRNGSYEEVIEFVDALRNDRFPKPTVEDILPSARICFSIADSLKSARVDSVS
ncbi:MAG TPA: Gfo/Idh/MocA family oxidoreductase [Pyrinomonadaceae bacterium]